MKATTKQCRVNLKDLSLEETIDFVSKLGKKAYTGRQLFRWIFKYGCDDFGQMTDLAIAFRDELKRKAYVGCLQMVRQMTSNDGTRKAVWQTADGLFVESVLIPDSRRLTLCLSSQVGCPVGCLFCATGRIGFKRNLSSGEIYDQFLLTRKQLEPDQRITNIVFMGMGEPLLNYQQVRKAIAALTSQFGGGLAARKITISTVGLPPLIRKLADDLPTVSLAVSLHSASEEQRRRLIPKAAGAPLDEIRHALKHYVTRTKKRVTFEYVLIKDINDSPKDAAALVRFAQGIPCKVNLIPFNEVKGCEFRRPSLDKMLAFQDYLYPRVGAVTVRKSMGADIAAACGQLAGQMPSDVVGPSDAPSGAEKKGGGHK